MALIYSEGWKNPTSTASIYIDTSRNGAVVTVTATVVCSLTYSSGYINYDGEINFNMWCAAARASANIKGYSDRWTQNSARTRTRTCSMSFVSVDSSFALGFNMTIPASRPAGAAFRIGDHYASIGLPGYSAPSAPTWISATPNPCSINASPTMTWGGARAGTLGRLYYDVEVRSTTPSGSWTDWLRISSAQSQASFKEIVLKNMNVHSQKPFVGVKYQYRVRSSDGSYATSGWIAVTLNVSFGSPTPPTSYIFSDTSIKKDGSIKVSWSGATGGSGSIVSYELGYRIYNHKTSKWSDWATLYPDSKTSYTFDLSSFYGLLDNTYIIRSKANTNYVINVKDNSTQDEAKINLWQYTGATNQQCKIEYTNDGFYKITFVNSGKCLDVKGAKPSKGLQLQQFTDNGSIAQKWLIRKNNDGTYSFITKTGYEFCMDVYGAIMQNGTIIQLHPENQSVAQKFVLENIGTGDMTGALLSNGDLIQFRIRVKNSWGQYSTYLTTSSVPVRGNQMWIKINGTWVEGDTYLKVNGAWVEATPYIKRNGVWYETT